MSKKHLWVESHSPQTVSECILPPRLKKEFTELSELPNMLFIGDAGVGKTTVAKALCEERELDYMFMNASMERGIDEVRNKIDQFASSTSLFGGYKVLLLDEADNLTADAQKAMRHLIERHQNNCRFVFTCNFPYKIIDPLRSRLTEYLFTYPAKDDALITEFMKRAIEILVTEKVKLKEQDIENIRFIVDYCYPNWRRALYMLQRVCARGVVDSTVVQNIREQSVDTLVGLLKAKNFTAMRHWVAKALKDGLSDAEVTNQLFIKMEEGVLKTTSHPAAILVLADYQQKAAVVASPEINLVAMCVELMMNCEWT